MSKHLDIQKGLKPSCLYVVKEIVIREDGDLVGPANDVSI